MTDVAAAGMKNTAVPAPAASLRDGAARRTANGFADALLDRIGDQHGVTDGDPRFFGGGTMRSAVQAFGAHGLFDGVVPLAKDGVDDDTPSTPRPTGIDGPVRIAPPSAALPVSLDATLPATAPIATGPSPIGPVAIGARRTSPAGPEGGKPISPDASLFWKGPAIVPVTLFQEPATLAEPVSEKMEPNRPPALDMPADRRASALEVALDMRETGVAVSVVGDVGEIGDEAELHHAVARLLARHGLVLGDLRITQRSASHGRQHRNN